MTNHFHLKRVNHFSNWKHKRLNDLLHKQWNLINILILPLKPFTISNLLHSLLRYLPENYWRWKQKCVTSSNIFPWKIYCCQKNDLIPHDHHSRRSTLHGVFALPFSNSNQNAKNYGSFRRTSKTVLREKNFF